MRNTFSKILKCIITATLLACPCGALAFADGGDRASAAPAQGAAVTSEQADGQADATFPTASLTLEATEAAGDLSTADPAASAGAATVEAGSKTVSDSVYLLATSSSASSVVSIKDKSKSSGANAEMGKFAATTSQAFKAEYDGAGFYTLTNVNSGKALAPADGAGASQSNVAQYQVAGDDDRAKWRIDRLQEGYQLVNKSNGLALEMESTDYKTSTNVRASAAAEGAAQRFYLVRPVDVPLKVRGTYYISLKSKPKSVIGTRSNSRKEGARAAMRTKKKTNMQRYSILGAGDGYCYLRNIATKRVISLSSSSRLSGAKTVMRDKTGAKIQKWKMVYNDDFSYAFVNAYSGMRLTASGKGGQNANLKASRVNAQSKTQRFALTKTSKRTDETVTIKVPCTMQNPELPTGCESVALTNALNYWGFKLKKTTIADRWMPYGGSGVYNFIGNPRNSSGWIICAPGIANTANSFLKSRNTKVKAKVVHGSKMKSLRKYIDKGQPVVVWTTIGMGNPNGLSWSNGYPLRGNNHAVVLSGYNPKTGDYRVSDSLAGVVWRNGARFTSLYNQMGRQGVVLKR